MTAEKVILAHRIWAAVGRYVNEFKRLKGKRDRSAPDWKQYYQVFLGENVFTKHQGIVDQVIPASIFFLSAVVFEDWLRVHGWPEEELAKKLESGDYAILNQEIDVIIDVRSGLGGESRAWPTLLKSQTLFEGVKKRLREA